jgi:hypothetical protein
VPVLRTGLVWEQNEFLGAHALSVDISDELKTCSFQFTQPEVRHLKTLSLSG